MKKLEHYNDYMDGITVDEQLHRKIMSAEVQTQAKPKFRLNPVYTLAASLLFVIGVSSFVFLSEHNPFRQETGEYKGQHENSALDEFLELLHENGYDVKEVGMNDVDESRWLDVYSFEINIEKGAKDYPISFFEFENR